MDETRRVCTSCGRTTVPETFWRSLSASERTLWTERGFTYRRGRADELCGACSGRVRRHGDTERKANGPRPETCVSCGRGLVSYKVWYATSLSERAEMNQDGFSRHVSGGLCGRCYWRLRKTTAPPSMA